MTDKTQTIEELKQQVEELKAQRVEELNAQAEERKQNDEIAELQRQLGSLQAGVLPDTAPVPPVGAPVGAPGGVAVGSVGVVAPTESDVKQAAMRQVLCGFAHGIGGPFASFYYSAKTGNWVPTLCATGVAFVGIPLALLDLGLTFAIGAPVTSAVIHITASQEKRRKLGITMPEQADAMLVKFRTF